jgi:hypothetical protein
MTTELHSDWSADDKLMAQQVSRLAQLSALGSATAHSEQVPTKEVPSEEHWSQPRHAAPAHFPVCGHELHRTSCEG